MLWLLEGEAEISQRLASYAEAAGIARERLIFAPKQANAFHLARYGLADLFLDAPLFSHNALTVMTGLWPVLIEGDAVLLRRLLNRFLHVATYPDPRGQLLFDAAPELFAHFSAISTSGYRSLDENQKVEFDITQGQKGPQASNIRPL